MAIKMVFYQSTPYGEIRKFVCSLDSDRSNLPISTSSTNRCDATSEAFIEETGKTYYLSSGDLWLEKKNLILPAGTNSIGSVSINGGVIVTHTTVAIGVVSDAALAANANRKYALLVNDSDSVIYLKIGAAAVANAGIRLNASGGSYEMSAQYGNLDTRVINAISSGAGKVLLVAEGV